MEVLVHVCCGPCSIIPLQRLEGEGYRAIGYFYNPNIHPYREYARRLETLRAHLESRRVELILDERYDLEAYLRRALSPPAGKERCFECYSMRLEKAASCAREHGLPYFSTTLLASPYQKHELVAEIGEKVAARYGLEFLYRDFRDGYRESVMISRELGMYRQPYCGCIFSEMERFKPRRGALHAGT